MPHVSIIVPVFNVETYLTQCIDSILGQSFKDFETILVDDGSPDKCPQICDDYARSDPRVKVIHKSNGGSSSARNAGLLAAVGEYVIFIDSDDYWCELDGLQKLIDVARREKAETVIFGFRKYFEASQSFSPGSGIVETEVCGKSFLNAMQYLVANRMFMISACNKLIKRKVLLDNEIIFVTGQLGEDLDWTLKLITCLQSVACLDTDIYIYRMREGSISKNKTENNVRDWLDTMMKWHTVISTPQMLPERRELCLGLLADAYLTLIYMYSLVSGPLKKDLGRQIKSLDYLFSYKDNRRVKMVSKLYAFCGLQWTSFILNYYIKMKSI